MSQLEFKKVEDCITFSQEFRQEHLNLSESCVEIGGNSKDFKGLLAHYLKTTIPSGHSIQLCHVCNNGGCSNPKHLYWGTSKENIADAIKCGANKMVHINTINKYGEEAYKKMCRDKLDPKKFVGSIWITNGTEEKRILRDNFDTISFYMDHGWHKGRSPVFAETKAKRSLIALNRKRDETGVWVKG